MYGMGDVWFNNSICENDSGTVVVCKMNMNQLCDMATEMANAILSYLKKVYFQITNTNNSLHHLTLPYFSAL